MPSEPDREEQVPAAVRLDYFSIFERKEVEKVGNCHSISCYPLTLVNPEEEKSFGIKRTKQRSTNICMMGIGGYKSKLKNGSCSSS